VSPSVTGGPKAPPCVAARAGLALPDGSSCGVSRRAGEPLLLAEPAQQPIQVGAGEAPIEWDRGLLVAMPETQQPLLEAAEVGEVVGGERLA
jgi:hypothetical protein